MILQIVAAAMLMAGDAPEREPSLLEVRTGVAVRPSFGLPIAMIVGGAALSVGGTAAASIGVVLANITAKCVGTCGQLDLIGGAMIAAGVAAVIGGVITAIIGHMRIRDGFVARDKAEAL